MFHCNVTVGLPSLVKATSFISAELFMQKKKEIIMNDDDSFFMKAFANRLLNYIKERKREVNKAVKFDEI